MIPVIFSQAEILATQPRGGDDDATISSTADKDAATITPVTVTEGATVNEISEGGVTAASGVVVTLTTPPANDKQVCCDGFAGSYPLYIPLLLSSNLCR